MKITFVHPPALMGVDNYSSLTQPPLGIAYLAAYMRLVGHQVAVVDAVGSGISLIKKWPKRAGRLVQGLDFESVASKIPQNTDVIGITCMFSHAWPMVRELILFLKERFPEKKL